MNPVNTHFDLFVFAFSINSLNQSASNKDIPKRDHISDDCPGSYDGLTEMMPRDKLLFVDSLDASGNMASLLV